MTAYWISLFLAVGLMLIARRTSEAAEGKMIRAQREGSGISYARWAIVASACVFILLTGLRYGIGQDYFYTYVPYFKRVLLGTSQSDMEIGFFALNWVVSRFTEDPTPVFFVCSILFFSFTYAAIMRESSNPVLSVFLLFGMSYLFIYMNAMRQMVAVAMLLYSIRYIEERKLVSFIVVVVLACTFHVSSIIFLIAYLFPKVKINIPICVIAIVVFFVLRNEIAGVINQIVAQTPYAGYIGSVFDDGRTGNVLIAMNIVVLAFAAIVPRLYGEDYNERYRVLLWCQLISTLIAILSGFIPLSQRVRWLFALPAIILLPSAVDIVNDERARMLIKAVIIILYVLYIAITIGVWNGNNVVPYQSVLFAG